MAAIRYETNNTGIAVSSSVVAKSSNIMSYDKHRPLFTTVILQFIIN